ncbi:ATP phosphoribosyltransferase regulatory subunit [Thermospira aquatica]|uniref:ATP phosphoribosyltransferase regulatory subunit n=1 Tax=Thermospira aquatica TaxID=2828656 RepID=A0AAX3BD48_9SPIR|nr:ATP phosphoribosyltransferase regulatory subunit [Thermospira aquatica]URA09826.1 ATP phosphoribosyltransferase regulatory subunit [Thermospira aquatica]
MPDDKRHHLTMLLAEAEGYSPGLPDGVFFLEEKSPIVNLGQQLCARVESHGYKRVFPPLFEFYDTYAGGGATDVSRRCFSFKDKDGSLLALRYDMTTPIARMVAQRYKPEDLPLRLYYYGDVFREQPFHQGKPRQIRQLGVELIGNAGVSSDGEVVSMACQLLSQLDTSYLLVIGDIRIYRALLTSLELSPYEREAVHRCFLLKDETSLRTILADISLPPKVSEQLFSLMQAVVKLENERQLKKMLELFEEEGEIVLGYLLALREILSQEQRKHVLIDLGMVKDLGYYSSLILEGYVSKSGYPVCHGGRYDGLYAAFGKNFPAVGWALDLSYTFRYL